MPSLRAQKTLLLKDKTGADEQTADNGEYNADYLDGWFSRAMRSG